MAASAVGNKGDRKMITVLFRITEKKRKKINDFNGSNNNKKKVFFLFPSFQRENIVKEKLFPSDRLLSGLL